jgi:hypothetical protein
MSTKKVIIRAGGHGLGEPFSTQLTVPPVPRLLGTGEGKSSRMSVIDARSPWPGGGWPVCPGKVIFRRSRKITKGRSIQREGETRQGKSQKPCSWMAGEGETEPRESIDKAIFRDGERVVGP